MKRTTLLLFILLVVLVSCTPTELIDDPVDNQNQVLDDSTIVDDNNSNIEETVFTVDSDTIETDLTRLEIGADGLKVSLNNPIITISVELTALKDINTSLHTSSYGDEGIIHIRVVHTEDEEVMLYSELYNQSATDDMHDVFLYQEDALVRELQFSYRPINEQLWPEPKCPAGIYKVQIALEIPRYPTTWDDTDIFINVNYD